MAGKNEEKHTASISLISAHNRKTGGTASEMRPAAPPVAPPIESKQEEVLSGEKMPSGVDLLTQKRAFNSKRAELVRSVATSLELGCPATPDSESIGDMDSLRSVDGHVNLKDFVESAPSLELPIPTQPTGDSLLARKHAFNDARSSQVEAVAASVAKITKETTKEVKEEAKKSTWGEWANGELEEDDSDEDFVPSDGEGPAAKSTVVRRSMTTNENSSTNGNTVTDKAIVKNMKYQHKQQNAGKKAKRKSKKSENRSNKGNSENARGNNPQRRGIRA
jgi:hypothetical protein